MKKLLIVEDDPDIGDVVSIMLTQAGYAVEVVPSRDEAVVRMRTSAYDLFLVDYCMPGMRLHDFLLLCPEVEQRLILMSAIKDPKIEAKHFQINYWLIKPFSSEELIATCERCLAQCANRVAIPN